MKNRRLYYGNGVKYNAPDGSVICLIPYHFNQPRMPNILSQYELDSIKHMFKIARISPNAHVNRGK
jgi:hypothetical protein